MKNGAKERRDIPGGFSYTTTPGVLAKALGRIIESERPAQFTTDFLGTVLGVTGGSARPIIPILKRAGFLTPDGRPTDRYGQFQSESKRASAALEALRAGWPELFRKNRYAHRLDRPGVEELFGEITGLKKTDPVFKNIVNTFSVFREFAKDAKEGEEGEPLGIERQERPQGEERVPATGGGKLTLSNQINIILPETTDLSVYHAIFRALRENLL